MVKNVYSHFTDEETAAWRGWAVCARLYYGKWWSWKVNLNSKSELLPVGYDAPLMVWLETCHNFVGASLVMELSLWPQFSHLSVEGVAAGGLSFILNEDQTSKGLLRERPSQWHPRGLYAGRYLSLGTRTIWPFVCLSWGQTLLYHVVLYSARSQRPH